MPDLKSLLQLSTEEENLLARHHAGLRTLTPRIIEDVHQFVLSFPELAWLLSNEGTQQRHRAALSDYIESITAGRYGAEYVKQRRLIGAVHYRLGVKPDWYLAACRKLFSSFSLHLSSYTGGDLSLYHRILDVISKIAIFDMKLAMDNYLDSGARALQSKKGIADSALRIFANTSAVAGEEFFAALASSIKAELDMQYVYIIKLSDALGGSYRILGASADEVFPIPPLNEWTPVEQCLADGLNVMIRLRGARTLYPALDWLRQARIETIGIALLRDSDGVLIGLIAVADGRPSQDEHRLATLLPLFSARAAMEIERIRSDRRLTHQATHDALTGLPNRELLLDRLRQELLVAERRGQVVAVLFFDLDNFKDVNDCFGHDTGDRLLAHVANILRQTLREEDIVARYGGDEFVVVLGSIDNAATVEPVVQELIAAVARPIEIDAQQFHCKVSVGIALYPSDGRDASTLLRCADTALYRTKEKRGGQYRFFTGDMNAEVVRRVALADQLRLACERGEIALHYQPQIDLTSGRIVGVEALLRWRHPHRGAVPPGEFIPVAEACGLIMELGDWVVERACRDLRAWRLLGHDDLRMAVNISPRQFESNAILDTIIDCLDRHDIPRECFEIELTESLLIANPASTKELLDAFRAQGVSISLDDFGTGYSSLSYLKQYPIQRLKIDRSFVRDVADDPNDAALVQAIIAMAKALDIAVIAEGIETQAQCQCLVDWGCPEAQGFYFGRPVAAETIMQLLVAKGDRKRLHSSRL